MPQSRTNCCSCSRAEMEEQRRRQEEEQMKLREEERRRREQEEADQLLAVRVNVVRHSANHPYFLFSEETSGRRGESSGSEVRRKSFFSLC